MLSRVVAAVTLASSLVASPIVSALTIGQIDTFQSSIGGWFAGGGPVGGTPPVPPQVVSTGGPTGANDAYLRITSTGGAGPGSRLSAINISQWAGNYLTAGFTTVEMDLINLGTTDLSIRLVFEDIGAAGPENVAVTDFAALLPAGGVWTHVAFALDPNLFTAMLGDVASALAETFALRIIHAATPTFPPEPVAGLLGVDNISAGFVPRPGPFPSTVPEPASWIVVLTALATFAFGARRQRKRS